MFRIKETSSIFTYKKYKLRILPLEYETEEASVTVMDTKQNCFRLTLKGFCFKMFRLILSSGIKETYRKKMGKVNLLNMNNSLLVISLCETK